MAAREGSSAHPITIDSDGDTSDVSSSYLSDSTGSDRVPEAAICGWRTTRFNDHECSRYFDCPSHQVERALSDNDVEIYSDGEGGGLTNPEEEDANVEEAQPAPEDIHEADDRSGADLSMRGGSDTPPPGIGYDDGIDYSQMTRGSPVFVDLTTDRPSPRSRPAQQLPLSSTSRALPAAPPPPPPPPRSLIAPQASGARPTPPVPRLQRSGPSDIQLPRWQPDAEAKYCPICRTQFSFFVRKHHCRKCGRVVCNACSPHQIVIPKQYIVRPPAEERPLSQRYTANILSNSVFPGLDESGNLGGGERVRLCNPCVPDPNTTPPQAPLPAQGQPAQGTHLRSPSGADFAGYPGDNPRRYGTYSPVAPPNDPLARSRSATMHGGAMGTVFPPPGFERALLPRPFLHAPSPMMAGTPPTYHPSMQASQMQALRASWHAAQMQAASRAQGRPQSMLVAPPVASSSFPYSQPQAQPAQSLLPVPQPGSLAQFPNPGLNQHRPPVQPTRQIAEEDECPICHQELPARSLPGFEVKREAHINECLRSHSGPSSIAATRRSGLFPYNATEKDCVDSAECTICLEEFQEGEKMARLECLCRFHHRCISLWFVKHPGQCPVHQYDLEQ